MKVSKRYPRRVGFDSGTRPEQMWKKIGWPRMDGCENCQGNALLLIHGRGTTYCVGRGREGAACAAGYPCRCDERGRHRGKGTKSQGSPLGTPHQVGVEIIQGACTGRLRKRVPYRARGAQKDEPSVPAQPSSCRASRERVSITAQRAACPVRGQRAGPSLGTLQHCSSEVPGVKVGCQQPHSGVNVGSQGRRRLPGPRPPSHAHARHLSGPGPCPCNKAT